MARALRFAVAEAQSWQAIPKIVACPSWSFSAPGSLVRGPFWFLAADGQADVRAH